MEKHKSLGLDGEKFAASFLEKKGFRILKSRYLCRYGEIDLIAAKERLLCFVEVKTRLSPKFSPGDFSVHAFKKERLIKTAYHFLQKHPDSFYDEMRFDCLLVRINSEGFFEADWRENIFTD